MPGIFLGNVMNAEEVLTPQRNFIFPVADGTVNIVGGEQRLRTATLTRDRQERGQEQDNLRGKSDELHSPNPLQEDSTRGAEEAKSDFWTITREFIYRHHVEPRVKLYVTREESFPIQLKWTLPEQHIHHWTYCWKKRLKITGMWMVKMNYEMHGQASHGSYSDPPRPDALGIRANLPAQSAQAARGATLALAPTCGTVPRARLASPGIHQ